MYTSLLLKRPNFVMEDSAYELTSFNLLSSAMSPIVNKFGEFYSLESVIHTYEMFDV